MSNDEAAEPRTVVDIVIELLEFMTDRVEGAWPDRVYIGGDRTVDGCDACGAHTGYPPDRDHRPGCPHVALIAEARAFLDAERVSKSSAPCSICGEPHGAGHSMIGHDLAVITAQRSCSCRSAAEPCAACIAAGGFGPLPAPAAPTPQWLRAIAAADAERAAADFADPRALARAVKREKTGGALLPGYWPDGILDANNYIASVDPAGLTAELRGRVARWQAARDVADPIALARAVADATRPGVARWMSNDGQTRLYLRRGVDADDMARLPEPLRLRLETYRAADTAQNGVRIGVGR